VLEYNCGNVEVVVKSGKETRLEIDKYDEIAMFVIFVYIVLLV